MAVVYISFVSYDRSLAQDISAALRRQGHTVILNDDTLIPGDNWRISLIHTIEKCNAVVVLVTAASISNSTLFSEIGAARALSRVLIPVIFGNLNIPSILQDLHCIRTTEEKIPIAAKSITRTISSLGNKNVFIVHGHNEAKTLELKGFISSIGLHPIILYEQDDLGKTIIEKFEYYARQCSFAFVLMTPDDEAVIPGSTEYKWRTRQNVIIELGWFMAKLGRERVTLLYKGEIDIPSDILGVIYMEFTNSILEVSERIRQRLKGVDLIK